MGGDTRAGTKMEETMPTSTNASTIVPMSQYNKKEESIAHKVAIKVTLKIPWRPKKLRRIISLFILRAVLSSIT
jgi:hypothetical protein